MIRKNPFPYLAGDKKIANSDADLKPGAQVWNILDNFILNISLGFLLKFPGQEAILKFLHYNEIFTLFILFFAEFLCIGLKWKGKWNKANIEY